MADRRAANPSRVEKEDAAAILQHRIERDERRALQRRRTLMLNAVAGLLGIALIAGGAFGFSRKASAEQAAYAPVVQQQPIIAEAPVAAAPDPEPAAPIKKPATKKVAEAEPVEPKPAPAAPAVAPEKKQPAGDTQRFTIRIGDAGYEPTAIKASSASKIVLSVGKGEGCAAGFLMPALGVSADNSGGQVTLALGRLKPGTYEWTCGMQMVGGRLVVE